MRLSILPSFSPRRSLIARAAVLSSLLLAGTASADQSNPTETDVASTPAAEQLTSTVSSVVPLPSFSRTPNIAAAVASRLGPTAIVRGYYSTFDGFQIYRCELAANGQPAWALRTPLAQLLGSGASASAVYHARSDFGGLVSDAEQTALGLLVNGVRATAPIWQFTITPSGLERRETVAGRVLAQDIVDTTAIPYLFIEVRGRAISTITGGVVRQTTAVADPLAHPIASSEYLLRFNTRGGLAPAVPCTNLNLGSESQQPYRSIYYFIDNNPPTAAQP